jgi:hypothetical protein
MFFGFVTFGKLCSLRHLEQFLKIVFLNKRLARDYRSRSLEICDPKDQYLHEELSYYYNSAVSFLNRAFYLINYKITRYGLSHLT